MELDVRGKIFQQISKRIKAIKSFALFVKINFGKSEVGKNAWCRQKWIFIGSFSLTIKSIIHTFAYQVEVLSVEYLRSLFCSTNLNFSSP